MELEKKKGFDGFSLKMIAVISMMIDHSAAGILRLLINSGRLDGGTFGREKWANVYYIMRDIGRIAFPIFCFLLVEGFCYTRNKAKYLVRLFLFALISEIPFDLGLHGQLIDLENQNVFFTLFLGMCALCGLGIIKEKIQNHFVYGLSAVFITLVFMEISELLHTDYHRFGVLVIVLFYVFREYRPLACGMGLLVLILCFGRELPAVFAFPLLLFYNGRRGRGMKYFFYVFYPAHLTILYLVGSFLGLYGSVYFR